MDEQAKLAIMVTLDLLVDQQFRVFEASNICRRLGGLGVRESWAYRSIVVGFEDHGYSGYEWPSYADVEILVAARQIVALGEEDIAAMEVVDKQMDLLHSELLKANLFAQLAELNGSWQQCLSLPDRHRYLVALLGRILVNPSKARKALGCLCISYPDLSEREANALAAVTALLGLKHDRDSEGRALADIASTYLQLR